MKDKPKDESRDTQIREILNLIDFRRIIKVMTLLDWYWVDTSPYPPNEAQLINAARKRLIDVWNEGQAQQCDTFISSGGLTARYEHWNGRPVLSLAFEIESHRFDVADDDKVDPADRERRIDMTL